MAKGELQSNSAETGVQPLCLSGHGPEGHSVTDRSGAGHGDERSSLNKRINHGGWSDTELWRLFRVLDFTAEEVAQSMGVVA